MASAQGNFDGVQGRVWARGCSWKVSPIRPQACPRAVGTVLCQGLRKWPVGLTLGPLQGVGSLVSPCYWGGFLRDQNRIAKVTWRGRFWVTKDFAEVNPGEVLKCGPRSLDADRGPSLP